jgi:hypothetical protein
LAGRVFKPAKPARDRIEGLSAEAVATSAISSPVAGTIGVIVHDSSIASPSDEAPAVRN